MSKTSRRLAGLVAAVGLGVGGASAAASPPAFYSAKDIRATIVDEQTGQPLEGVAVVAQWVLRRPYSDGPRLQVTETVTDAQGQFFVSGWSPKPRPPWMWLQDKSPLLLLFKHGYVPLELRTTSRKEFAKYYPSYRSMKTRDIWNVMDFDGTPDEAMQECFWDGMTIQLEPFRGKSERWVELLRSAAYSIPDENAKHTRRFLEAVRAERSYLDPKTLDQTKRDAFEGLLQRIEYLLGRN